MIDEVAVAEPAQERWRAVVEALPDPVLLLNEDNVITYASPALADLLGVEPQECVGVAEDELVHVADLPQLWRTRATAAGRGSAGGAIRLRTADGSHTWVESSLTRVADPISGRGTVTVVRVRDISADVAARQLLVRQDRRYRALLGTMHEAALVLGPQAQVEAVNRKAVELLGIPGQQLLGASFSEELRVWDEHGRPVEGNQPSALLSLLHSERRELWCSVRRGDGRRILLRVRMGPLSGADGEPGGGVLILQDALAARSRDGRSGSEGRRFQAAGGITPREGDVLEALAAGSDIPAIANKLTLSVHSVRGHVKSLMAKLGAHSQLQAVLAAARRGMVTIEPDPQVTETPWERDITLPAGADLTEVEAVLGLTDPAR